MDINYRTMQALTTAYRMDFNKGFNGVEPLYKTLAEVIPSTTAANDYPISDQYFFKITEWKGDRKPQEMGATDYKIENKEFEGSVAIKRKYIQDDQFGMFGSMFEGMGRKVRLFPDKLIFQLIKNGHIWNGYDGVPFFAANHSVDGKTYSNIITGSAPKCYLIDDSQPLKPFIYQERIKFAMTSLISQTDENVYNRAEFKYGVDGRANAGYGHFHQAYCIGDELTTDTFSAAYDAMCSLADSEGEPLGIKPTVLLCGQSNRIKAHKVVQAKQLEGLIDNPNFEAVRVVVSPWFA